MTDRLSVAEAAEALVASRDAVFKRIERNKISHERGSDGQLYVYVDRANTNQPTNVESTSDALISELRERVAFLSAS
jgi:hypothetical protein